jgi:tetratricopeptide (TPR) repeat protein
MDLARSGDREGARHVFRDMVYRNPYDEDSWVWLAWVAETPEATLSLLLEAQTLLPDSQRIAEGVTWAREQLGDDAPSAETPKAKASIPNPRRLWGQVEQAAQAAQQGTSQTLDEIKGRVATAVQLPRVPAGLRGWMISVVSIVALVALGALVYIVASQLRQNAPVVHALDLPAPVVNPTATPSVQQRTGSFWTQVDIAWMQQDWPKVIEALQRIRLADPYNDEARQRLAEAHYQRGLLFVDKNDLESARIEYNKAIRLDAASKNLQRAHSDLELYLAALDAYWAQDWPKAVGMLQQVYQTTPAFRDTRMMLGQAYSYLGVEMMEKEQLESARNALRSSVELLPDWQEAQVRLTEVENLITPPRRIEVDLSDKLVVVFEDNQPIKTFRVCTGRPSAPTVAGRYKIQTKLDMAYASRWDLNMPHWLGIYDAGGSENGFHALPILSNGQTLWRSALGTGCSYGCIVLDTPDAKWLYDWAELGVVVFVTR